MKGNYILGIILLRVNEREREEAVYSNNVEGKTARTICMMFINIHFTLLDNEQKPQTNSARKLRVTILLLT